MICRKVYTYDDVKRFYAFFIPLLEKKFSERTDEYADFYIPELRKMLSEQFAEESTMLTKHLWIFLDEMFEEMGLVALCNGYGIRTNRFFIKKPDEPLYNPATGKEIHF